MKLVTEMSSCPPEYTVDKEGTTAIITFYTDVKEIEREDETAWSVTMWQMRTTWMDNLPQRVAANSALWLAKVKSVTAAEEARDRAEQIEKTATDDAITELAELTATVMDAVAELAELVVGRE